jgi:hypothetical protein
MTRHWTSLGIVGVGVISVESVCRPCSRPAGNCSIQFDGYR